MQDIFSQVRACQLCHDSLPLGANPIIQGSERARIVIIGQAPGIKAHQSSTPFNDASGRRLREWLGVSSQQFYDPSLFAIIPMAFCYPGKGKSGDLPPPSICAQTWHRTILATLRHSKLTLLIGQYAQKYYLTAASTLTANVSSCDYQNHHCLALPHPSPRNRFWLQKNPWFEQLKLPILQHRVEKLLAESS